MLFLKGKRCVARQRKAACSLRAFDNARDHRAGRMRREVFRSELVQLVLPRPGKAQGKAVKRIAERVHHFADMLAAGIDAQRDLVLIFVIYGGYERAETADARIDQQFFHNITSGLRIHALLVYQLVYSGASALFGAVSKVGIVQNPQKIFCTVGLCAKIRLTFGV